MQSFVLADVDPNTMESPILSDNNGKALINGVSVAIEAGDAFYVGSFQGNRLLKLRDNRGLSGGKDAAYRPGILALCQTPAVI